ncbi:hypothetical protein R1flu_011495 [Riccia fluitans]|uniref:SHSP domain-containing protein n=1 Tax=Riccia fluitans TaxID=41844 RepID=A0ABD1Z929_9MARC
MRGPSSLFDMFLDWLETSGAHVFKVHLPGLKKREFRIHVEDEQFLGISGERNKEQGNQEYSCLRVERSYGKFHSHFRLPGNTSVQEISAKMEKGVLTVTVPKTGITMEAQIRKLANDRPTGLGVVMRSLRGETSPYSGDHTLSYNIRASYEAVFYQRGR